MFRLSLRQQQNDCVRHLLIYTTRVSMQQTIQHICGQISSVTVSFDLWFCIKEQMSFVLFNSFRNVNVIHMQRFNPSLVAIIHVSIHNTKRRYIICITNIKLHFNKIIPCIKHVAEYIVIIEADGYMFETVMFFVVIKH